MEHEHTIDCVIELAIQIGRGREIVDHIREQLDEDTEQLGLMREQFVRVIH